VDKRFSSGLIIISILIGLALITTGFFFFSRGEVEIDETWIILCSKGNRWDEATATWIQDEYGGNITYIEDFTDEYNVEGQNIIIVGGSKKLSEQAPWLETWPLSITKPPSFPDVGYEWDYDRDGWRIRTPISFYYPDQNTELGFIAKAYDTSLRRWIIAVLGYNWYGTTYGGKLLIGDADLMEDNTYIIFRCTSWGDEDPYSWALRDFDGYIIEYG